MEILEVALKCFFLFILLVEKILLNAKSWNNLIKFKQLCLKLKVTVMFEKEKIGTKRDEAGVAKSFDVQFFAKLKIYSITLHKAFKNPHIHC